MADIGKEFQENYRHLIRYIRSKVGEEAIAEDVVQESFYKALKSHHRLKDEAKVLPWVYKIVHFTFVDLIRRKKVEKKHLDFYSQVNEGSFEDQFKPVLCECINGFVANLRSQPRRLIELELLGHEYDQIAEELGVTKANLKVIKHRANKKLRQSLLNHCKNCAKKGCLDCDC